MCTVDDGGHGEDNTILIIDDGIHRFVPDNWKVVLQVTVLLQIGRPAEIGRA